MNDAITLDELLKLILERLKPATDNEINAIRLSALSGSPTRLVRVLDIEDVVAYTSLSRRVIYELISEGKFPRAKQLTERRVGWEICDLDKWLNSCPQQQPNPAVPQQRQSA